MAALAGKRVWITGAGSGIGAAAAESLLHEGAALTLSGRRIDALERVAGPLREKGGEVSIVPLDVSDADAVAAAEIGPVDVLVASAGLNVPNRSLDTLTTQSWDQVISVNLNGLFYTTQAVVPGMQERGGGTIILISSWAGRYASRLTGAAYNASKRAVLALNESLNDELGEDGIRSTVIMPGEAATEILDKRPSPPSAEQRAQMLQPEDLGETIRFVATMPNRVCLNEILISPTRNRFYQGFDEL